MLVVLDNCEHLPGGHRAELATTLLSACPAIHAAGDQP